MMFDEYNFCLSDVVTFDNYWSDFGIFDAIRIMNDFSDKDWTLLKSELAKKSNIWVISCTETLSEIKNVNAALEILDHLLGHGDEEVVFSAIDGINALMSNGNNFTGDLNRLINILNDKEKTAGKLELLAINSLRTHVA